MNPEVWGPSAWLFLHTVTLNYPNNPTIYDKQFYKNFFMSLNNVLPCDWCSKNYSLHLAKYPIDNYLNSKKDLVTWLILIHNEVNKIFEKKTLNYEEVIKIYKELYNKKPCNHLKWHIFILCSIIIIIIIFLYIYFYYPKFLSKFQSYFQVH